MKAIILAAGFGSRLYPLTKNAPKGLLKVVNQPAILRQIRQIRNFGIQDITVVLGFHANQFKKILDQKIKIYYSPHFKTTGSLYSLWIARREINNNLYILNSDFVYEHKFLEELRNNFPIATSVMKKKYESIDVKVKVKNGNQKLRIKETEPPMHSGSIQ